MTAKLSSDGKVVLPQQLREIARLEPGDTLEAQFYKGTIVLRKYQPLTPEQCAALLERSRSQPKPNPEDDRAVEQTVQEVRARRR
jgi:bifunctional DNA-binding transcriptional regulator/antitoxin component of YhaV-PrlF toxin-antitoxin module